jgi:hypothetical protein
LVKEAVFMVKVNGNNNKGAVFRLKDHFNPKASKRPL